MLYKSTISNAHEYTRWKVSGVEYIQRYIHTRYMKSQKLKYITYYNSKL